EGRQLHNAGARLIKQQGHPKLCGRDNTPIAHQLIFQITTHVVSAADAELFKGEQSFCRPLTTDSEENLVLSIEKALDVLTLAQPIKKFSVGSTRNFVVGGAEYVESEVERRS